MPVNSHFKYWLRPGSLSRQLVLRTAALVALVALLLGTGITLASQHILLDQVDNQLASADRIRERGPDSDEFGERPGGLRVPGMPSGTVQMINFGSIVKAGQINDGQVVALSDEALTYLLTLEPSDDPQTITIPGLGAFRAEISNDEDSISVIAIPLAEFYGVLNSLIVAEVVLGIAAVLMSIAVSGPLIQRSLRPLSRLADAASEVSHLELGKGAVDLRVRVDATGLDSRNEVAQVGTAFNHMLNNVEGALTARHASEMKVRQFVADASHELRNPLAAIRGYAELTRRHAGDLGKDTNFALSRIDAESARMSKLVNDLLLLARLDNDPVLSVAPVDMTEVVLNAVSDARAASPDHQWTIELPEVSTIVPGEADRLHQVITNLLSNARNHTPPGTLVRTVVEREPNNVVVRVIDNGPGIPPEQQAVVFERFARGDKSRAHSAAESTGLGLAIVSAVVSAHHGRVWLTSRPGHTEFSVALPVTPAA